MVEIKRVIGCMTRLCRLISQATAAGLAVLQAAVPYLQIERPSQSTLLLSQAALGLALLAPRGLSGTHSAETIEPNKRKRLTALN